MIAVLLVMLVGIGITYAFFSPTIIQESDITVDVTTSENATITFENGSNVNLSATEPGITTSALFNVKIESNGESITGVYDIYWVISENEFEHDTTPGHENDKEITYSLYASSDGYNWSPIVANADATALNGAVKIATNELVVANNGGETTKYYKMDITYPTINKDQSYNMGKSINGYIEIRPSM